MSFSVSSVSHETQYTMKSCGMLDHAAALPFERLKEVFLQHYDFDGNIQKGSVVVLDVMADDCCELFEQLYQKKFPIHSVRPICHFMADDNKSMNQNNTSAYNPRFIAGTNDLSVHSYGMALDINPVQNPYLKFGDMASHDMQIYPAAGKNYLNCRLFQKGMVEDIVPYLYKAGFSVWGGAWTERRIDYHHFQAPASIGMMCAFFDNKYAKEIYALYKKKPDFFIDFPDNRLSEFKKCLESSAVNDLDKQIRFLIDHDKTLEDLFL